MKKGFTLIELLVVIGIIGILAGITLTSFSGGTEAARAAKCMSNMRNLVQGAIAYATRNSESHLPYAGSHVRMNYKSATYSGYIGWISWLDKDNYYKTSQSQFRKFDTMSACCANEKDAMFAITNGTIWKYVGQSRDAYVCPEHLRMAKNHSAKVRFSYAMNAYFGYDKNPGGTSPNSGKSLSSVNADRTLMFAELPFGVAGSSYDTANTLKSGDAAYSSANNDTQLDAVLQYGADYNGKAYNSSWSGTSEAIAFNHKNGKKWCAHVAFADGHVEKLALVEDGKSSTLNACQLTALLCEGVAVGFDGGGYFMHSGADR